MSIDADPKFVLEKVTSYINEATKMLMFGI